MSPEVVLSAHDTPPPPIRNGLPEPKGRDMGRRADVVLALEAVFGPLNIGPNGTGAFCGGPDDPDGDSLLVDLGEGDPCTWIALSWRGIEDMNRKLAALRRAHRGWYVYHPIAGEWDHHL